MNLLLSAADLLSKELELLFGTGLLRDCIFFAEQCGYINYSESDFFA